MTDDLVKRLRDLSYNKGHDLPDKAADRIEHLENRCANLLVGNGVLNIHIKKLETALTHIYAWYPISIADPHQTIEEIRKFARNALEEDDD